MGLGIAGIEDARSLLLLTLLYLWFHLLHWVKPSGQAYQLSSRFILLGGQDLTDVGDSRGQIFILPL